MTIKELAVRYFTNPEDFWCEDTDTIIELHREEKAAELGFIWEIVMQGLENKTITFCDLLEFAFCYYEDSSEDFPFWDEIYDILKKNNNSLQKPIDK